ncbi:MAG TPA: hypothetical protein VKY74_25595 [Chloroflexia bacterium]|nr:hypothetical protein [Chloroflexia bacterium]
MDLFAANQTPVASDNMIIETYPQPLARAWQRVLIASPRPTFHHQQLLVAAETLAFYLAAVAISAYEQSQAEGGPPDPTLNRSLRNLRRLTFGQWLGWVRTALGAVPSAQALVPGLQAAYETPDSGMTLFGYETLRGLMVVGLGYTGEYGAREVASPRLLLEMINQYQLRRATHPPAPDAGFDDMAVVTALAPGLRAAYSRVALLAAYPLLGLVRTAAGATEVVRLAGLGITASTVELEPEVAAPGTLLLANPDELPMLVLDPWLIYAECTQCGQVQIAAFAGQAGVTLRYHGLECEHNWARGPERTLAQVELGGAGPDAAPGPPGSEGLSAGDMTDAEAHLFAVFSAESDALAAERRAVQAARPPAAPAPPAAARTDPRDVYQELFEQRAARGLTLDQLQQLDEERVAAADRRRRGLDPPEPR